MSDHNICQESIFNGKRHKIQLNNKDKLADGKLLCILEVSDFDLSDSYIPSDDYSFSGDDYG